MSSRSRWILISILIFITGVAGSYLVMRTFSASLKQPEARSIEAQDTGEFMLLRMFYPKNRKIEMIEKKLPRRINTLAVAESVVEEFLRSINEGQSKQAQNVKILGIYKDQVKTLYINISDEIRRNFRGDALDEYLLIKGIYESIMANVPDLQDIKILIEDKEIETLGGHLHLKYPLKNIIRAESKSVSGNSND